MERPQPARWGRFFLGDFALPLPGQVTLLPSIANEKPASRVNRIMPKA
jgi:hypothetical protein